MMSNANVQRVAAEAAGTSNTFVLAEDFVTMRPKVLANSKSNTGPILNFL